MTQSFDWYMAPVTGPWNNSAKMTTKRALSLFIIAGKQVTNVQRLGTNDIVSKGEPCQSWNIEWHTNTKYSRLVSVAARIGDA